MDGITPAIPSSELYAKLGTAATPLVIDVRREADFKSADSLIVSAFHRAPEQIGAWKDELANERAVVGVATGIGFQPTGDGKAAITGDFVLAADEVNPVMLGFKLYGRLNDAAFRKLILMLLLIAGLGLLVPRF